jgi:hypothetical protein
MPQRQVTVTATNLGLQLMKFVLQNVVEQLLPSTWVQTKGRHWPQALLISSWAPNFWSLAYDVPARVGSHQDSEFDIFGILQHLEGFAIWKQTFLFLTLLLYH